MKKEKTRQEELAWYVLGHADNGASFHIEGASYVVIQPEYLRELAQAYLDLSEKERP